MVKRMKASDFRTKRYLLGYVTPCAEKVYTDSFNTKRELHDYQNSDFYKWFMRQCANLIPFVEYHKRRGFFASDFDYIKARKYQILALKRSDHFGESYAKQLKITVKHKAYFGEAIECNSLDEMRSIPA
jgi:hypothetical protein